MIMKNNVTCRKSLFDIAAESEKKPVPKKRTRASSKPKPEPVAEVKQPTKTDDRRGWKDYSKTKPGIHVPCDFFIDTGKKVVSFRGFMQTEKILCTDDPYKATVMRKKYGNMFYKEIKGCTVEQCESGFPRCESCKKAKGRK